MGDDFPLFISVMIAGVVGSITHCSLMCSPLVATQMLQLDATKRSTRGIYSYHAGRILTYSVMGLVSVLAAQWVFAGGLSNVTHIALLMAGAGFVVSAALPRKTHGACCTQKTRFASLETLLPQQMVLFLRGMAMGTMPCGMTLSVLLVVATLANPVEAMIAMALFGLSTTPMLQLSGLGALRLKRRYPHATVATGRGIMALNGLFLCSLGLNIVSV